MEVLRKYLTVLVAFFCLANILHAQQEEIPAKFKNTLQINITGTFTNTLGFVYTRNLSNGKNLLVELGYTITRPPVLSNAKKNLKHEEVGGFFIKAGPEFCKYKEGLRSSALAVLPFYGSGRLVQEITITHPLGEYEQRMENRYQVYGISAMVNQVLVNFGRNWFFEGSMEMNLAIVESEAVKSLGEYPGVGGFIDPRNNNLGLGVRFLGKVGYRF